MQVENPARMEWMESYNSNHDNYSVYIKGKVFNPAVHIQQDYVL